MSERINHMISHSRFDVDDGTLERKGGVEEDEEIGERETEAVDGGEEERWMRDVGKIAYMESSIEMVDEEGEEEDNLGEDEENE